MHSILQVFDIGNRGFCFSIGLIGVFCGLLSCTAMLLNMAEI